MSNIVDNLRSDITEAASLLGEGWEVADDRELAGPGDLRVYCRVDNGGYLHPDRARYEVNAGYSHLADDLYVYPEPAQVQCYVRRQAGHRASRRPFGRSSGPAIRTSWSEGAGLRQLPSNGGG